MPNITALTADQMEQLKLHRDKWLAIGLSTQPADRKAAERHVDEAYCAARLDPPPIKLWLRSPMEGAISADTLHLHVEQSGTVDPVRDLVRDDVWDQACGYVGSHVGSHVWDRVRDYVQDDIWDQVWDQVGNQVWDQVCDQERNHARGRLERAAYGLHDASWLGFCEFFLEVCGLEAAASLRGMIGVAQSCGWWWPFRGAVILTERPNRLCRDDLGRLHSDNGAAIQYPDGWGVYAWHGLRIDERLILRPESITVDEIEKETDTELRRMKIERYGRERYIRDVGCQKHEA